MYYLWDLTEQNSFLRESCLTGAFHLNKNDGLVHVPWNLIHPLMPVDSHVGGADVLSKQA